MLAKELKERLTLHYKNLQKSTPQFDDASIEYWIRYSVNQYSYFEEIADALFQMVEGKSKKIDVRKKNAEQHSQRFVAKMNGNSIVWDFTQKTVITTGHYGEFDARDFSEIFKIMTNLARDFGGQDWFDIRFQIGKFVEARAYNRAIRIDTDIDPDNFELEMTE